MIGLFKIKNIFVQGPEQLIFKYLNGTFFEKVLIIILFFLFSSKYIGDKYIKKRKDFKEFDKCATFHKCELKIFDAK